jgi:maltose alpha-D-glucosyltransferase/alpha-amylase
LSHTGDQHPWFRQSQSDPAGPYGEFYLWAGTDEGLPGVPIIFPDTETSNWAFDQACKQYRPCSQQTVAVPSSACAPPAAAA